LGSQPLSAHMSGLLIDRMLRSLVLISLGAFGNVAPAVGMSPETANEMTMAELNESNRDFAAIA